MEEAEFEHLEFTAVQKPLEGWGWHLGEEVGAGSDLQVIGTGDLLLVNKS